MMYHILATIKGQSIIGRINAVFTSRPINPFTLGELSASASSMARKTVPVTAMTTNSSVQEKECLKSGFDRTLL